jgi:PncC family amidohydrolase
MIPDVSPDLQQLASQLLRGVAAREWRLGTAESLTGGMLGAAITAVPGASTRYAGGIVSYSDQVKKSVLGVPAQLLARYGAVSGEVAEAMARGCQSSLDVEVALATTGVAGPASDDRGTAVGTVFIACATPDACVTRLLHLTGDRERIRHASTRAALELGIQLAEGVA